MPRDKDLKRLVRARMKKTGEAYTAARAQVVRKSRPAKSSRANDSDLPPHTVTPSTSEDYASVAGMSDASVAEKTGRTWEQWVRALDGHAAEQMSHGDLAKLVNTTYKVDGWWSQMVTVGYERLKGLRARGQRRDGTYEANKSRTFDMPVTTLYDAWANASVRRRWLNDASVKVRTATKPTTMRLDWGDRTIVVVGFMAKGTSKSAVAVQHTKVPDKETADRLKQYWAERMDALGELLTSRTGSTPARRKNGKG